MKKATAIITARGGSKGVKRKNIRLVGGKPLIAFSIAAALQCPLVEECYVTSEDAEIIHISEQWGAKSIDRPELLAGDYSLSTDAVAHALHEMQKEKSLPEYFVLLQPTSPLRTSQHLLECLEGFFQSGAVCGISVTYAEHHPWKMLLKEAGKVRPLHDHKSLEMPRQQLPEALRINGAIYVMASELFLQARSFYIDPAYWYYMDAESSIDIDSELDLKLLELICDEKDLIKERCQ